MEYSRARIVEQPLMPAQLLVPIGARTNARREPAAGRGGVQAYSKYLLKPSERQWGRRTFEPSEELREPTIGAVGRDRSFAELKDNVKILRVFPTGQQFLRLNLEGF